MKTCWRLPLVLLCAGVLAVWPLRQYLTAEAIAARSPRQVWLAALFLLALYVLKGLSMAFPLAALEAAGGLLFPFPAALAVNAAGVLAAQTAPYLLGRRQRGIQPPPKAPGQTVFLLRLAGAAPGDLVSFCLGAAGVPWRAYLTGGALGSFPRVLCATWLGAALWDIGSPRFFLSLLPGGCLTLLALLLWRILCRRSKKGHPTDVLSAESSMQ